MTDYTTKDVERFWAKVKIDETDFACWEWIGRWRSRGYGKMRFEGWNQRANRISYKVAHGAFPENLMVCHHCDNPLCVNPNHLFLDSQLGNNRDRKNKRRNGQKGIRLSVYQPLKPLTAQEKYQNMVDLFWSKILIDESDFACWEWQASKQKKGYGQFGVLGRMKSSHRLAWEFSFGKIPDNLCVCHHYDNRGCCNPNHFFLGTKGDNNRDRAEKGRNRKYYR